MNMNMQKKSIGREPPERTISTRRKYRLEDFIPRDDDLHRKTISLEKCPLSEDDLHYSMNARYAVHIADEFMMSTTVLFLPKCLVVRI